MSTPHRPQVEGVLHRLLVKGVEKRDLEAYFDRTYHPDVVIHESPGLPYGGEFVGLEGATRHAAGFVATWDRYQEPHHYPLNARAIIDGSDAVVLWELSLGDGHRTRRFPYVSHYRFEGDLIAESRMYPFDLAALLVFLEDHR